MLESLEHLEVVSHLSTLLSPPQGGDQGHTHVVIKTKFYYTVRTFHVGSMIKNPPAVQEPQVMRIWFLGWEDSLEEDTAIHSSILAWRIPGQRSLVSYSPWGAKSWRRNDLACSTCQENAAQMVHRSDSSFFWIYGEMWFYFSQRFIIVAQELTFCWWPISGFWL